MYGACQVDGRSFHSPKRVVSSPNCSAPPWLLGSWGPQFVYESGLPSSQAQPPLACLERPIQTCSPPDRVRLWTRSFSAWLPMVARCAPRAVHASRAWVHVTAVPTYVYFSAAEG